MQTTVKLFLSYRTGRFNSADLDLPESATVGALIDRLAIAEDTVGLVMINGRQGELESHLSAGDTVLLFPIVGGG